MPANIETMFSVGQTPWHRIGKVLSKSPKNIKEAMCDAGLNWNALVFDPFFTYANAAGIQFTKGFQEHARVLVRSDNMNVLGVVGPNTTPLQNLEAFEFFQPFLDANEATLETAGSLAEGSRVWVMAKINRDNSKITDKPGDEIAKFVLLSNSHDNTLSVRVGYTPVRVVCQNTLSMAHGHKQSKLIRVRHTSQVKKSVDKIRETMNLVNEDFETTAEQYRALANRGISQADLKKYVKTVFKWSDNDDDLPTRTAKTLEAILAAHEENASFVAETIAKQKAIEAAELRSHQEVGQTLLDTVLENFEKSDSETSPNNRGTLWSAYNAVTRYLTHDKGREDDSRVNSLWYGQSAQQNDRAFDIAMEMLKK